jgi:hypothetical protein
MQVARSAVGHGETAGDGTQRTANGIRLAGVAGQLVVLTGTPIVSNKMTPLVRWLEFCVVFPITKGNEMVVFNAMAMELQETGAQVQRSVREVELST